jgi:hypothetical protein
VQHLPQSSPCEEQAKNRYNDIIVAIEVTCSNQGLASSTFSYPMGYNTSYSIKGFQQPLVYLSNMKLYINALNCLEAGTFRILELIQKLCANNGVRSQGCIWLWSNFSTT